MAVLNLVSYNIKGINNPIKRKKLYNQLKHLGCSVALIQETHLSDKEHLKLKREWVNQVYSASCKNGKKRGVAILFHRSVNFLNEHLIQDNEGRYVMVVGKIDNVEVTILNLYAPNEDCPQFFQNMASIVADKGKGIIIVGGDFNCILNRTQDRLPKDVGPKLKKSITLQGMIEELGLVDIWRSLHPRERDFTYMSPVHGTYSRIDFFAISKKDSFRAMESKIEPITISDHAPITLRMSLGVNECFKYWRLNVSLLTDPTISQELQNNLKEYINLNDVDNISPSILWEGCKAVMRGKIIAISSRIKKQRMQKQKTLEDTIKKLQNEHKQTQNKKVLIAMKEAKQKLDDLLTYKAEGALRFVNRKYYEMGNKASRLLAFQLKKAQSGRIVTKIKHPITNIFETQPKDIAGAFAAYYNALYESQNQPDKKEKIYQFLEPLNMVKLNDDEAANLVKPITTLEVKETINKLKNNKSPGVDGYPGEYYKTFINELAPVLTRIYNYALNNKDSPASWSDAVITVIKKEGKDPTLCSGYRPISLLCVDLKILTSILAKRVQKYIKKLVKPEQTGFINGRHGSNNIRKTLNLQSLAISRKEPSMLLSLDAEKAFDRVDWLYLECVLKAMGFGDNFVDWIMMFYKTPRSRVRVNGCCSDFFNLGRGTRQGDGLSPVLFALSIEPLAESVRQSQNIQGIRDESGLEHKIALFADDVLLYLQNMQSSVPALLKCLHEYGYISGFKINENKSEAMMLSGTWPTQLNTVASFRQCHHGFRYLGITLTTNPLELYKSNYNKLMANIKADLLRWEVLPLSIFGRIETIKMNVLPRILYLFQSLPVWVPTSTFTQLDKMLNKFIWQNKRPRVRLKVLCSPKDRGGVSLPNIRQYYWAAQLVAITQWINNDQEVGWVTIEQNAVSGVRLSVLPFLSNNLWKKLNVKNIWVKQTLRIWDVVRKKLEGPMNLSRAMSIAGNIEFQPSIWDSGFKRWECSGLCTINQLFEENHLKSFSQLQEQFSLPSKDHYRFLQIRHYLQSHAEWNRVKTNPTGIEEYFIAIKEKHLPNKNHVSCIYKKIMENLADHTFDVRHKWELELNVNIDDKTWRDVCGGSHKGINSNLWKEFDWKCVMRYFRTPLVVSNFYKTISPLCWRNCGKVADHTHIFWDCPVLSHYWQDIKHEIETILTVNISMDPMLFIFGIPPENITDKVHKYVLRILLLSARKIITVNWRKPSPPTKTEWTQRLKHVYLMELLTAKLQMKTDLFFHRWTPVTKYLKL